MLEMAQVGMPNDAEGLTEPLVETTAHHKPNGSAQEAHRVGSEAASPEVEHKDSRDVVSVVQS